MKKRYIVIMIIIIVYFAVFFILYGKDEIKKSKLETTIIVNDSTIWQLKNKKWYNIRDDSNREDLNWEKFNIIIDNKEIGKYKIVYNTKWYLYDDDKNPYQYTGNLLAYQANYKMKVKDFEPIQISDYTYVNQLLEENFLPINQELTVSDLVSIDFDDDGINENFYLVSNAFPYDGEPENIFTIVFMEKSGVIYKMYNSVEKNKGYNGCKPYINDIIDVNDDGKYEIILTCAKYSVETPIDMLYTFTNNDFRIIISNQ